jgi:hypothetical protein
MYVVELIFYAVEELNGPFWQWFTHWKPLPEESQNHRWVHCYTPWMSSIWLDADQRQECTKFGKDMIATASIGASQAATLDHKA